MKEQLLENFRRAKVAVIGDIILDRYTWGDVSRISPEAPVPVVRVNKKDDRLGGAANTAQAISALEAPVTLIGRLGDDLAADRVKKLLDERGIDFEKLPNRDDLPTTVKSRVIAETQHVVRVDDEVRRPVKMELLREQKESLAETLAGFDAVLLSDYGKGVFSTETLSFWLELIGDLELPVVVDPHSPHFSCYRGATILTPNERELREGMEKNEFEAEPLAELAPRAKEMLGLEALLVTQGDRGMTLFEDPGSYHIDTEAREVYDVTGAGDAVAAIVTLGEALGADRKEVIEIANLAAGLVVARMGTTAVKPGEIKEVLET